VRNVAVWLLNVESRVPKLNAEPRALNFSSLERGEHYVLEQGMGKIMLGLGWSSKFDLDASCVLYNGSGVVSSTVYYGKLSGQGVKHSGDILSGTTGINDDEQITVDLLSLSSDVTTLLFVVHIFTTGKTFDQVEKAYVRLVDEFNREEKCRYTIDKSALSLSASTGLVMCKVYRPKDDPGHWKLITIGDVVGGRWINECLPSLKKYLADDYVPEGASISHIV